MTRRVCAHHEGCAEWAVFLVIDPDGDAHTPLCAEHWRELNARTRGALAAIRLPAGR